MAIYIIYSFYLSSNIVSCAYWLCLRQTGNSKPTVGVAMALCYHVCTDDPPGSALVTVGPYEAIPNL